MKNWFKNHLTFVVVFGISLLVAALYRDSFLSPFFQDDKFHLSLVGQNPFAIIPNFPYRPISLQFFYSFAHLLFGDVVFGYHFILFILFTISLYYVYKLSLDFLKSPSKSTVVTFVYALNVSIFANFYWVAVSYFVFASLFLFSSFYYFKRSKKLSILSVTLFTLALLSNEVAILFPLILIFYCLIFKENNKSRISIYLALSLATLIFKYFFVGLPKSADYQLSFTISALSTLRWYILRASNLPEGVDRIKDVSIWFLWAGQMVMLLIGIASKKLSDLKITLFGIVWLLANMLPFIFLPSHMSSYYLSVSLFGSSLIIGNFLTGRRMVFLFCLLYLSATIIGLNFLSQTHWIILKNTGPIGKF